MRATVEAYRQQSSALDHVQMASQLTARGAGPFDTVDFPLAAPLFAQRAGRLVPTASDCGVVAVSDRRLATAPYRKGLLESLPAPPLHQPRRGGTRANRAL